MKIKSIDQDIRNLLLSGYYRIPRFQRPYSWLREHIEDFWNDIIREDPSDYFIGSMVVFGEGKQPLGIVDGQQRLTTIMIFLAVLRNTLDKHGFEDLANGIHGLIERHNLEDKKEFVLSTESSYPFFQDHILKRGAPELEVKPMREEENLQAAYDLLDTLVAGAVDTIQNDTTLNDVQKKERVKKKLCQIRDALLDLKVILIRMDDEDDAYIIFETLNTRGKDLNLTDLVKNHVTRHLKAANVSLDQVRIKWTNVLETIEGSTCNLSTDAFIHHFWLSRYDYLPAKKLFKQLKRRIGKGEAKGFLDDLVSDAALYRGIHEIAFGKWSKEERRVTEGLDALQLFHVAQQTPCVLSLVRAYKSKKITKKQLEDAIVAIEKFHFLFTAVTSQRSSGGISAMYAALGRRLFEALDNAAAYDVIRDVLAKLRERIPSIDEVKALFPDMIYTESITKNRNLIKYILGLLGKELQVGVTADIDAMTIEHLAPQSLIGTANFTEQIIGQVGNLILVSSELNGKLGNKSFADKRKMLLEAGFKLPPELKGAANWTAIDIQNRTQTMAVEAYNKIWKI